MNILEAYDLTGSLRDAAELAGCSHHTVARYVRERERGRAVPGSPARRPGVIDVEHVAGIPVRHPGAVAFGRHYGLTVATCVPYDPASKGGSESTVKVAKADLVPTQANLLAGYGSFAALEAACAAFCE